MKQTLEEFKFLIRPMVWLKKLLFFPGSNRLLGNANAEYEVGDGVLLRGWADPEGGRRPHGHE